MLSQNDIIKEIGKGINSIPLKIKNIKENSLNLTASSYAWTYSNSSSISAVEDTNGKKRINLKPHRTTLIVTEEVLGFGSNIGGTVHSKVSCAVLGLGHLGTMFGPCYKGRFLIPVHNITDENIFLEVGDTFASLVFHYLDSKKVKHNNTSHGHINKYSTWHISTTDEDIEYLDPDWANTIEEIRKKQKQESEYAELKKQYNNSYINIWNFLKLLGIVVLPLILFFVCKKLNTFLSGEVIKSFNFYNIYSSFIATYLFTSPLWIKKIFVGKYSKESKEK